MGFWETVLASVLGTSGAALVAWLSVSVYRRYRTRNDAWRVRPMGSAAWSIRYVGRRPISDAHFITFNPEGRPRLAEPAAMPQGTEMTRRSAEDFFPAVVPGGSATIWWKDRRGQWMARVIIREGLEPWTVPAEREPVVAPPRGV